MIMQRELCHIWGPFSIYSYGLAIAIGVIVFTYFALRHPWRSQIISQDKFIEIVALGLIIGILGGRILFILNSFHRFDHWTEIFDLWSGGLSILGSIIAILIVIPCYLHYLKIPILKFFDLAALFAPLIHAIARLGCFMAGCCYGKPTNLPWAITYTDQLSDAPLHIPLHPTQLYMSASYFIIFLFFYFVLQKRLKTPGLLLLAYLMSESVLRFSIDFLRDDREYFAWDTTHYLTAHQWIALGIFVISLGGLLLMRYTNKAKN